MFNLNDTGMQFLNTIWDNFKKNLPDSVKETYDSLYYDAIKHIGNGFSRPANMQQTWLKNELLMTLADLAHKKTTETDNKSEIPKLKLIRDTASKNVLTNMRNKTKPRTNRG